MGWAKLRDGLGEWLPKMRSTDGVLFVWLLTQKNRAKEPKHVVETSIASIAQTFSTSRMEIYRRLARLEQGNWVRRHKRGIEILNPNGDDPRPHDNYPTEWANLPGTFGCVPDRYAKCTSSGTGAYLSGTQSVPEMLPHLIRGDVKARRSRDVVDGGDDDKRRDCGTGRKSPQKARKSNPDYEIHYDEGREDFTGYGRKRLDGDLNRRYGEEFGEAWIRRVWRNLLDWCRDKPDEIRAKRDHRKFVLGWFRRDAAHERERLGLRKPDEPEKRAPPAVDETRIAQCPRDHECDHATTQNGVRQYCPDGCGWTRLAPEVAARIGGDR